MTSEVLAKVRALAEGSEFATFASIEILDALEVHRHTPYFPARFGGPLPHARDALRLQKTGEPSARYVTQLAEVYGEKHPVETFEHDTLSSHPQVGRHFQRQRVWFYSAEALRLYARDSVPRAPSRRCRTTCTRLSSRSQSRSTPPEWIV